MFNFVSLVVHRLSLPSLPPSLPAVVFCQRPSSARSSSRPPFFMTSNLDKGLLMSFLFHHPLSIHVNSELMCSSSSLSSSSKGSALNPFSQHFHVVTSKSLIFPATSGLSHTHTPSTSPPLQASPFFLRSNPRSCRPSSLCLCPCALCSFLPFVRLLCVSSSLCRLFSLLCYPENVNFFCKCVRVEQGDE